MNGDLCLENCANIESLPSCIFEWGPSDSGGPHIIYLGGSGICRNQETMEYLQNI